MIPVPAENVPAITPQTPSEIITPPSPSNPPDDLYSGLKQWQRDVLQARLIILSNIDAYQKATGRSLNKAIKTFLTSISNGGPAHLKRATEIANNRKGENRLLSWQTIYRWAQRRQAEGNLGLVPEDKETASEDNIPLWLPPFLEAYRQPSKPSIPHALRQMGDDAPKYHQVIRYLKKFSNLDIHRGRMSGSELRAIRAYIKRDFSDLFPMDIIVADGHSFKAYVAHPVHGKRFLPEVEAIIDVATRNCIGWSTGLSESGQVVADALRHAVTVSEDKPMGGLYAILYTDNGAGNRAKMNSDEVTGIVARSGGTIKFGIAGNPQGRGIIERLNESLWIPAAKTLISYNGKDMDALAQRKRLKIIDKDLKEKGSSQHLLSWPQFIDFLGAEVLAYNNRPHSELPKIIDAGGNKRHMTPVERWQSFMSKGWMPDTLNAEEMRDIFRPQIQCITNRGLVRVFSNDYFNKELEHHHGETVYVNYDIHDPKIVWVRDTQQRMICEAYWNGNRRAFYPVSVIDQAREKREERRLSLKRKQIREIEEEAMGVIEGEMSIPEECVEITHPTPLLTQEREFSEAETDIRPFFGDDTARRYEWHLRNGFKTEEDLRFKVEFEQSDSYKILQEYWR